MNFKACEGCYIDNPGDCRLLFIYWRGKHG